MQKNALHYKSYMISLYRKERVGTKVDAYKKELKYGKINKK